MLKSILMILSMHVLDLRGRDYHQEEWIFIIKQISEFLDPSTILKELSELCSIH
jgi:hypothetical protein